MALRVAIVGATGNVGQEILNILDERLFPADEVIALASRASVGRRVSYGDKELKCYDIEQFDFSTVDLCLMSAGSKVAMEWAPKIALQDCIVIDNSSAFRMDPLVPLVPPAELWTLVHTGRLSEASVSWRWEQWSLVRTSGPSRWTQWTLEVHSGPNYRSGLGVHWSHLQARLGLDRNT